MDGFKELEAELEESMLREVYRKRRKPFWDVPQFYTPLEAETELDFDMPQGWMLKLYPDYTQALINPKGEELSFEDVMISPEGGWISRAEIEAMEAPMIPEAEPEIGLQPLETEVAVATKLLPMTPERYYTEKAAYEALTEMYPEQDIESMRAWLGESDENIDEFLTQIQGVGRNIGTETLLRQLALGISEEEMREVFGGDGLKEIIPPEGVPFPVSTETGEEMIFTLMPDHNLWYEDKEVASYNLETGEITVKEPSFWEKVGYYTLGALQKGIAQAGLIFARGELPESEITGKYKELGEELERRLAPLQGNPENLPLAEWKAKRQEIIDWYEAETAKLPSRWAEEERLYHEMPWYKQLMYEAPLWLVLSFISAGGIRAALAPTVAKGGLKAVPAITARGALLPVELAEKGMALTLKYGVGIPLKYVVVKAPQAAVKVAFDRALNAGLDKWLVRQGIRGEQADKVIAWFLKRDEYKLYKYAEANLLKRVHPGSSASVAEKAAVQAADDTIRQIETLLLEAVEGAGVKPTAVKPMITPPPAVTGVPAMITKPMENQLVKMGYSAEVIAKMTPAEAWGILYKPEAIPEVSIAKPTPPEIAKPEVPTAEVGVRPIEAVVKPVEAIELSSLHYHPARTQGFKNSTRAEIKNYLNRLKRLAKKEALGEVPNINEAIRALDAGDLGAAGVAADTALGKIHKLYKIHHPEFELTKIPTAEAGMPEAGLQPSMIAEVPAMEIRPAPKAEVVQARLDDYLKIKEYTATQADSRITEINELLATKGKLPSGKGTKVGLRLELARLEAQKELASIETIEQLDDVIEKIQTELGNRALPYHGGTANLFPEYNSRQLDEQLKIYEEARSKIGVVKPTPKAEEIRPFIPGVTSLTTKQIDATLTLFGQAIVSPTAEVQRMAAIELRKHILAQRAHAYAMEVEKLIIEGKSPEEAMTLAKAETLSGKLPEVTTDFYSDLTEEMREVLFAKVYSYWREDAFEQIATAESLTNALLGKSIPRKRGTGTRAFPQGGSAWDRLARTFADHPEILKAIDQQTSLQDIIEGIFIEAGRQALPLDQKTVDYLRGLTTLTTEERLMLEKPLGELKVEHIRVIAEQEFYRRKRELRTALDEGRIDQVEYDLELRIAKDKAYPYPAVTTTRVPTGRAFGLARLGEEAYVPAELAERKTAEQIAKETAELEVELAPPPSPVTRFEPPIEDAFTQIPLLKMVEKKLIARILKELAMSPIDIGNLLRANKASFDFSFWRQEKTLAPGHPAAFYRANIEAWKALWSQKSTEANWEWVTHRPSYPYYANMIERTGSDFLRIFQVPKGTSQWKAAEELGYLTGERLIPRLTAKIPWIKVSGRSFVAGTNTMNMLVYDQCLEATLRRAEKIASGEIKLKEGEAFSIQKEMDDYASFITDATQRASLGKAAPLAPALGSMFFAPRSKLGRLLTPRHLLSSNPRVRALAWKDLSLFVGTFAGLVMLGYWLDLWDVETDPRSGEYMSIRIGNLRIDPWAGYRQFLVFYTRVVTGTGVSSVTGKEYEVDPIRALTSFFRTSLAPMSAIILDFWTGTNFLGEKVDVADKKQWAERLSPFAVWDIWEAYEDDWLHGTIAILPAIVGEGVQTYTGDWVENWAKLGLTKYNDNLPYGMREPRYTTEDFWADIAGQFKDVDPATLTEEKGYPEYIRALAEARQILALLDLLPNVKLTSINSDPEMGYTFNDYYQMWLDREKLVAAGDTKALEEFDADERTRNAHLGNMTQRQYALLVEYHFLPEKEQKQFLEEHPEIAVDIRDEWLKAHPIDNAKLAIWGKAKLLTYEAYEAMLKMIKDLDIPDAAIPELTLPPEGSVENYFDYRDVGKEFGYNSAEANLIVAEDDVLREWLGRQPITTNIKSLEISVKWRELDDEYEALDADDRPAFLEAHPDYANDRRRRDGYGIGLADNLIEDYLEWHKTERVGFEDDWFLMEHKGFYEAMVELEQLEERDFSKVPDPKWKGLWADWVDMDEEYDEGIPERFKGVEDVTLRNQKIKDAREKLLLDNSEYADDRRRRDALTKGLPENLIEDYVAWYNDPSLKKPDDWKYDEWYEDDWYLMEHPEFHKAMVDAGIMQERDLSKVPTREVWSLYKRYLSLGKGQPRLDFRIKHPELDDWLVKTKNYVPAGERGKPTTDWVEELIEEIEKL